MEEDTFVDLRLEYSHLHFPVRVLIKQGDCLFIRNDILHRGCENMSDFDHHRLHCHIEPESLAGE